LREHPPEAFITLSSDDLGWLTGVGGESRWLLGRTLPAVSAWLQREYVFERQIEHFSIWRRRPTDGSS
jgi:hypothetical protein